MSDASEPTATVTLLPVLNLRDAYEFLERQAKWLKEQERMGDELQTVVLVTFQSQRGLRVCSAGPDSEPGIAAMCLSAAIQQVNQALIDHGK